MFILFSLRYFGRNPYVLKLILPRLCDELENSTQDKVAEKLSAEILRIVREFRRDDLILHAREEFLEVYHLVKRLGRSVKLSRMQGATATRCNDIKDILARDFAT